MAEFPSRIPPHNLDAERAVLGAVLLEGREALPRVIELLRSQDFYLEAHRTVFESMLRLFDRGDPVDLITLSEELRRTDQLQAVGGHAALALLVEQASIAAHLMAYAAIVRDMATLRQMIQTCTDAITEAFENKADVQALMDDIEKRIFALAERRLEGRAVPVEKILKNTFEYIERLYERKEHVTGVATGFEKLDLETSGFQPSDFIIIAGRPSMGKAQPLDARVKTRTGWKRMGDLRLGDELASIDGRPSRVSGVFPQGVRQVYRVTFSDGRATECCGEHLWRVHSRGWPEPRTLTTDEVAALLRRRRYRHRLGIDVVSGDFGRPEPPPVDPFVLGALLGDGKRSGSRLMFSTAAEEMLAAIAVRTRPAVALRAAGGYDWRIVQAEGAHRRGIAGVAPNAIIDGLRRLGLWGVRSEARFIPEAYLEAPRTARLELLRGLMDTDGWVERWGSARFCSASERLANDVAALVRSLGGWCSIRSKRTGYTYRGERRAGRTAYVCTIHYAEPKEIFRLSAKRDRALDAPRRRRRPVFLSIEPARVTETQCIAVTHPSQLYVTDDYVVTHNTAFALNIAQHVGISGRLSVLILSLEMSAQQLVQRLLCAEAKVDSQSVRTGYLSAADWHRLTAAAGRLSEAKIFIDDSPALTALEARAKARRMKAEHGLDLLIIDYLQLMRGRNSENRQQEISEISRSLKALAKELNVPVVALSQLSRAVESRAQRDFRPQLSDLRECVTGETLVLLADGRRVPIRELVDTAPEVLSMSADGRIVTAKSEKIWRVGVRPVFEVKLASGRSIRATAEHRLFSGRGWTTVSDLKAGDRLAVARSLPEPMAPERWPDLRVALLGHLIGDGSYLNNQPLRYSTGSEENSAIVTRAAEEEFGCEVKRYRGRRSWHQLLITRNGNRWHPSGINGWLRQLGIFGQRSHEKRIPDAAFQLSDVQTALLLRHLWATDGTIVPRLRGRGSSSVRYNTNSPGLAADVAALLLRLGIVARIYVVRKPGYRAGFHVAVSGTDDQQRFLDRVGAFGPRVSQRKALNDILAGRVPNTNVDTLPAEDFERVKHLMNERGITWARMSQLRGTAGLGFHFAPSRPVLAEYAEFFDDDELRKRATNDLFWDRILTIDPVREADVFDLTVPGSASWLADGIVSHNSGALEQDSDVILFLYRSRVYKDDVPPDEEKIAEIIIGKQRNGPIGTVKVVFLPEYARFENISDTHRAASQPF
jgi:replicative DNA helicase